MEKKQAIARLALRLGQAIMIILASAVFLAAPDPEVCSYHRFSYLGEVVFCVGLWTMTMAVMEAFCLFIPAPHPSTELVVFIVVDWLASHALLWTACWSGSVSSYLLGHGESKCPTQVHTSDQFCEAFIFLSWFFSYALTLFDLWLVTPPR